MTGFGRCTSVTCSWDGSMNATPTFEAKRMTRMANPRDVREWPRALGTLQPGDSTGHGGCRSSFLGHPTRSCLSARDPKSENRLWKLPEPWTPRTRPPLLGKLPRTQFPTASTGPFFFLSPPEKCYPCSRLTLLPMFPVAPYLARVLVLYSLEISRDRSFARRDTVFRPGVLQRFAMWSHLIVPIRDSTECLSRSRP